MKNLNSFKAITRAIESEAKRHIYEIESGGTLVQETRRWDDEKGLSFSMRNKEEAKDYRYFPDPDLPPVVLSKEWIEEIMRSLPELPEARRKRYIAEYSLPEYDASLITKSKALADFFEEAVALCNNPKSVSNWIMGDILRKMKDEEQETEEIPIPAQYLADLIILVDKGVISNTIAKKVFNKMYETKKDPKVIVKEEGLEVVNDESALIEIVKKVIEKNPQSVADFKSGKEKAFGFLVGQAMKETKGKANPQLINKLLREELSR